MGPTRTCENSLEWILLKALWYYNFCICSAMLTCVPELRVKTMLFVFQVPEGSHTFQPEKVSLKGSSFIWITPGASQVTQWVKNMPATQETQESQVWFPGLEEPLEKGMAIHSSILAWRNPWTKRHLEVCVHRAAESWHDEWLSTQAQHAGGASAGDIRDAGLIPGSGRSPGVGNASPLQYSSLENNMDRGACVLLSMGSQRVRRDWSGLACTQGILDVFHLSHWRLSAPRD